MVQTKAGKIDRTRTEPDLIKMNPDRSKSDINTKWIFFYGISDDGFYPNQTQPKWISDII